MNNAHFKDNIWIPDFAETVEECMFFAVEITDGSHLSREAYTSLFFIKLVNLIDNDRDEELSEDFEIYFPSLEPITDDMSNEDIALMVVESKEFYYGFPPVNDEFVKCVTLDEKANETIESLERDDFLGYFEEIYNFRSLINYVTELHDSFLASNSDHVYDNELSNRLSNPEKYKDSK
jgi:hypothetical protein